MLTAAAAATLLVQSAAHNQVASFDDDAYPLDRDYFARAVAEQTMRFRTRGSGAAVSCAASRIVPTAPDRQGVGRRLLCRRGACVFRRDVFLTAGGYVPVPERVRDGRGRIPGASPARAARPILQTGCAERIHDTARSLWQRATTP